MSCEECIWYKYYIHCSDSKFYGFFCCDLYGYLKEDQSVSCRDFVDKNIPIFTYTDEGNKDKIIEQIVNEMTNYGKISIKYISKERFDYEFESILEDICELRFTSPIMQKSMFESLYEDVYQKVVELLGYDFVYNEN